MYGEPVKQAVTVSARKGRQVQLNDLDHLVAFANVDAMLLPAPPSLLGSATFRI
jgi:hypothetical protein